MDWHRIYLDARACGLTAEQFWESTPKELSWAFDAYAAAERRASERLISLSWWIEALHRQKQLKPLKSLLDRLNAGRPQTPEEQRAMIETLSTQYGLKLRRRQKTT